MPEKIICPRCGVEQIRREKCIVCGYEFGVDEQTKIKERKEKILTPPTQKTKSKKESKTKQRSVRGSSSIPLVGVEGTKELFLSPAAKLFILIVLIIVSLIGFNRYTLHSDLNQIKASVINVNCPSAINAPDKEQLEQRLKLCVKRKIGAILLLKGHDINIEEIQVNLSEPDVYSAEQLNISPNDRHKIVINATGKFRFKWLGVYWDTVRFNVLGYADISGFKPKPLHPKVPEGLERNILNISNTITK